MDESLTPDETAPKKKRGAARRTAREASLAEVNAGEAAVLRGYEARSSDSGSGMDGGALDDDELGDDEPAEKKEGAAEPEPPAVLVEALARDVIAVAEDVAATKREPVPAIVRQVSTEPATLIVQRATANRRLVWALVKGREADGPVRLCVRSSLFYRPGEEVEAREMAPGEWEACTHRAAPRYGGRA